MHPSTLLVALTIGFSQVTLDVFASDPDSMGSSDNATTGVPSRPPMGTVIQGEGGGPAPCANNSSPEYGADVPPVPSGGSPTPADNDAGEPSDDGPPPVSSGDASATQPSPNGTAVSATSHPGPLVPGDMSSGQCMCPSPPTCGAGEDTGPEPSENGTASDPTSQTPPNGGDVSPSPAPTDGGFGNDTTTPDDGSAAAFMTPEGKVVTGLFAAVITFFAL